MTLRVATWSFVPFGFDVRAKQIAEALASRGDEVVAWCPGSTEAPNGVAIQTVAEGSGAVRFVAECTARFVKAHLSKPFDLLIIHAPRDLRLIPALAPRVLRLKMLLDVAHVPLEEESAGRLARLASLVADGIIAASTAQYDALLRAGVRAYDLHVVTDFIDPRRFVAREREPHIEKASPVPLVADPAAAEVTLRVLSEARKQDPRLKLTFLGRPDRSIEPLLTELGLDAAAVTAAATAAGDEAAAPDAPPGAAARAAAHAAPPIVSIAEGEDAFRAMREATLGLFFQASDALPATLLEGLGVALPAVAFESPALTADVGPEAIALVPPNDLSAAAKTVLRLAKDLEGRKKLAAGARAWNEASGALKQVALIQRAVDFLCAEKVLAEKRARQAAVEGVKTGSRKTPPKTTA